MKRHQRLRKNRHFQRVYASGGSWTVRIIVLRALPNHGETSRFGFVVSKRLGNAVVRNRIKRRMREAVRLQTFSPGWDLVFIGRQPIADATFAEIQGAVAALGSRAQLVETAARA